MALVWPPPHFLVKPNVLESASLCFHLQATLWSFLGIEFITISSKLTNIFVWLSEHRRRQHWPACQHGGSFHLSRVIASLYDRWELLFGVIQSKYEKVIFNLTILFVLLAEHLTHCQVFQLLCLLNVGFRSLLFAHKDCCSKGLLQPLFFPKPTELALLAPKPL